MRHTASTLAILVAAFCVGCQDNLTTEPISNLAPSDHRLPGSPSEDIVVPRQVIDLNAVLHAPGNVLNSFIAVSGTTAYSATLIPLDPIPPAPQFAVRLNLTTDAELRPYELNNPLWYVSGASDDLVVIPESGVGFVEKNYAIQGRSDGMTLRLKFRITLTSVELNGLWLELPLVVRSAELD